MAALRGSAHYSIVSEIIDAGGLRAKSASYTNDGSVAAVVGISAGNGQAVIAKAGYAGQLFEIGGLVVNSVHPVVAESDFVQLGAWQLLDDVTFLAVDANAVTWDVLAGPITGISPAGVAAADLVYQDTLATVRGTFGDLSGTLDLAVLDSIPDNFGGYAGDGIGDDWQVQYFGPPPNANAAPDADFSGTGQTNLFKYIAGLNPTDPNAVFRLLIESVPGQATQTNLIFSPRFADRIYSIESRLSLTAGQWNPLSGTSFSDDAETRTVTDPNATDATRFYRVLITKP